jgi:hypothetical protein
MKPPITLRSTLSNTSWSQCGAVALLLVAALMFTLTLALRANTYAPASAPAVRPAAPAARNLNVPITGTGSAYDGSHYGSLVSAPQTAPNVPISGTGSAYDGGHYGSSIPALLRSPNVPISGTGSAYDGGDYRLVRTTPLAPVNLNVPISGTDSAYNGQ